MAGTERTPDTPDALDPGLVDDFVTTGRDTLERLEGELVALERAPAADRAMAAALRSLRTLRVAAGILGLSRFTELADAGIGLLAGLRSQSTGIDRDGIDALLCLVDASRRVIDDVATTGDEGHNSFSDLVAELRRLATVDSGASTAGTTPGPATVEASPRLGDDTVRVDRTVLADLARLSDQLLVTRNQLAHQRHGSRSAGLARVTETIDAITDELQSLAGQTRRLPIAKAWTRLPRFARDLAIEHGKLVELDLSDESDVHVDQAVLDAVREPVAAALAELIEHAIEAPEVREAAGRTPRARISLRTHRADGHLVVDVECDEEAFEPTDALGRVSDQRGLAFQMMRCETGQRLRWTLPIERDRLDAVLVRCAGDVYALPRASITDRFTLDLRRALVTDVAGAEVVEHDGRLVPLVWLRDVLCLEPTSSQRHEVIVLGHDGESLGLVVDRRLGDETVLLHQVPVELSAWGPFDATTVCGSGEVALVVDIRAIVGTIGLAGSAGRRSAGSGDDRSDRDGPVRVLAARIGDATVTIPTALVDELASVESRRFVTIDGSTTADDGRGPISILALPDMPHRPRSGACPVIVHERDGVRFGIPVDEVLGEHHFPRPTPAGPTTIGIAASPLIGSRALDEITLDDLIQQAETAPLADHG